MPTQNKKNSYAILGFPLLHTLSPPIHKRLFELSGIAAAYSVEEVAPEDLTKALPRLKALDGFNVTIPHKLAIMPFLEKLDASAQRYGAVNCVKNIGGSHVGYNTDCYGFTRGLSAAGVNLSGKVLLLGCGGAGRMMATEAALSGAELTIAARERGVAEDTLSDIRKILPDFSAGIVDFSGLDNDKSYDLLINATPVGMFPNVDACPVSDSVIEGCAAVFDAVYNPRLTLLLKKAEAMGKETVGGMGMLVWQAVIAHEIWDDAKYDDADINALISEMEALV